MNSVATTKDLEKVLTDILKPHGFRKKKHHWYYDSDDCICVVNLQKDDFGGRYYINLGVLVTRIDKTQNPLENKCHIRMRLDRLLDDRESFVNALDLENTALKAEGRIAILTHSIEKGALPFLMSLATIDGIRQVLQKNQAVLNRTVRPLVQHLFPEWYQIGGRFCKE